MHQRQTLHGFVLHKRPYRETSLLIDFFTLEQGRVSAVAKGARGNSKSDRKSLLQPFQLLEFELSGRSNLRNLGRLEGASTSIPLQAKSLYCGFYVNEIITRALPEALPFEDLFRFYQQTLQLLSKAQPDSSADLEVILREFEFTLLHHLGYLPDFQQTADSGEPIVADGFYYFQLGEGFITCNRERKYAIEGKYLLAISRAEYQPIENESSSQTLDYMLLRQLAKTICRQALSEVIGNKPIKSRELFR